MPRRTTDFRGLAEPSRVRLLREVQAAPGSTLKQLADGTGLHINTAREHLQTLEKEGFVTSQARPTGARGRPPVVYLPVDDPSMNAAARRRIDRAREKGDLLRRIMPDPDRTAGLDEAALHQLDALYEHLDDAGLSPELDEPRLRVGITPCPFYRIVDDDRELACAVHARILRDILTQVPGPLHLQELLPFVGPTACLVVLGVDSRTGSSTADSHRPSPGVDDHLDPVPTGESLPANGTRSRTHSA